MDVEMVKAIGEYIITPLCIVGGLGLWMYFMSR